MPRYWLSRLMLALQVLVGVVLVSWFEGNSLTSRAIEQTGRVGWGLILLIGASCVFALMDFAINDAMPARFTAQFAIHWRHLGYMVGIALPLAILSVLVAFSTGFTTLLLVYWLDASCAAVIAFLDVFARMRPR